MTIRHATRADLSTIAKLGAKFHEQAGWSDVMPYDEAGCVISLAGLMNSDKFICVVAGDPIHGMAAGIVSPVYFCPSHISGEELFWWVDDAAPQMVGLRLLDALERAAREKGAQSWQMKDLAKLNGKRMTRLYERRGYRASEQSYIKRF